MSTTTQLTFNVKTTAGVLEFDIKGLLLSEGTVYPRGIFAVDVDEFKRNYKDARFLTGTIDLRDFGYWILGPEKQLNYTEPDRDWRKSGANRIALVESPDEKLTTRLVENVLKIADIPSDRISKELRHSLIGMSTFIDNTYNKEHIYNPSELLEALPQSKSFEPHTKLETEIQKIQASMDELDCSYFRITKS